MSWFFVVYAAVATVAGLIPWLQVSGNHRHRTSNRQFAIAGVANFVAGLVAGYLATPFFYGPFAGVTPTILIFGSLNACAASALKEKVTDGTIAIGAITVLFVIVALIGLPMWEAERYHDLIGTVEDRVWKDDESPVDVTHIRTVSEEQAKWLGNKVIGEAEGSLGSRYKIGEYHIQRVGDELYWVAPLEFRGIVKWLKYRRSAGFVMVSAENRSEPARLVANRELRYMPSAYFGKNLRRHLYKSYATSGLTEYTFELDDTFEPHWVVTVFHPSITYFGPVVDGVIIVDPETGESQYHRVGDIPNWVDRVYPEAFVQGYIKWYGKFGGGWWNSWLGQEGVEQPTPHGNTANGDVFLVWSSRDGQPNWFTGVTSVASTDQSLNGFMMVDSRTGSARRYRMTGPNEVGVLEAIDNAVSNYEGWHGVQPILYNVGGEPTWVAPVVGANAILQRVAMANAQSALVALGTDVHAALREYRALLAASGMTVAPSSHARDTIVEVRISRIGTETVGGRTLFLLHSYELPDRVFAATSDISPELAISQVGEVVTLGFAETSEPVVQLTSFDNLALNIRRNDEQVRLDERETAE